MAGLVYATENVFLTDSDGLGYRVVANQPWADDDPLVKRHPGYFSTEPRQVMRTQMPVEQATHAPGEQRGR